VEFKDVHKINESRIQFRYHVKISNRERLEVLGQDRLYICEEYINLLDKRNIQPNTLNIDVEGDDIYVDL